jgi:hypothetical protein
MGGPSLTSSGAWPKEICEGGVTAPRRPSASRRHALRRPHSSATYARNLVNATFGFEALAALTNKPAKSLHRMLSKHGNPSMDNLAVIFDAVRQRLGWN